MLEVASQTRFFTLAITSSYDRAAMSAGSLPGNVRFPEGCPVLFPDDVGLAPSTT